MSKTKRKRPTNMQRTITQAPMIPITAIGDEIAQARDEQKQHDWQINERVLFPLIDAEHALFNTLAQVDILAMLTDSQMIQDVIVGLDRELSDCHVVYSRMAKEIIRLSAADPAYLTVVSWVGERVNIRVEGLQRLMGGDGGDYLRTVIEETRTDEITHRLLEARKGIDFGGRKDRTSWRRLVAAKWRRHELAHGNAKHEDIRILVIADYEGLPEKSDDDRKALESLRGKTKSRVYRNRLCNDFPDVFLDHRPFD